MDNVYATLFRSVFSPSRCAGEARLYTSYRKFNVFLDMAILTHIKFLIFPPFINIVNFPPSLHTGVTDSHRFINQLNSDTQNVI